MNQQNSEIPKSKASDHLHTIVRAGLGMLPVVGNPAAELFNSIVTPPIEKRRDEWRCSIGVRLLQLEQSGFLKINDLTENEAFVSATVQASYAAIRGHQEEKLAALRNAVVNSALWSAPSDSLQQIFIKWIDELTVEHLRFLDLFRDPRGWFARNNQQQPSFYISSSLTQILESAYPELARNRPLYELIAQDLEARKLFGGGMHTMMSANGAWEKRTTEIGDQFLAFISDPEKQKKG